MSEKEVVVILPYVERKILMQLRDADRNIPFAGYWGFFGGAVNQGEEPDESARRELFEELGYRPSAIYKLETDRISQLEKLVSHSYYCRLTVPVEALMLSEGMDLGLFSLGEIKGKALYSRRMRKLFPVIGHPYIAWTVERVLQRMAASGNWNSAR